MKKLWKSPQLIVLIDFACKPAPALMPRIMGSFQMSISRGLMSDGGARTMNFYSSLKPIGTTAKTGESCPESGVWQSMDSPSTTAPIAKGNRMPPHNGRAVTWKLIRYA